MKLTRIIAPVLALMMVIPGAVSAEEQGLKTSLSGDVKLELNLSTGIGASVETTRYQYLLPGSDSTSIALTVVAHLSGSTDADKLAVSSNSGDQPLTIDQSGGFDKTLELPLSYKSVSNDFDGGSSLSDITFPDIIVKASKGDYSESIKYAGGKINASIPVSGPGGTINSTTFSTIKRTLTDSIPYKQGVNQNLTKEWVARNYSVTGSAYGTSGSVLGQLHYKGVTDSDKLIISYPGEGALVDNIINVGSDGTFEKIIDINGFCDTGLYGGNIPVIIKAVKGQNEVLSTKVLKPHNRSLYIGDINDDGKINSIDYVLVKKYVSGMIDKFPLETGFFCADVNDDRKINSADASYIKRYILGIVDKFPKQGIAVYTEDSVKPYKIYLKTGTLEPGNQAGTDDGNMVGNGEQAYIIAFTGPITDEMKKSAEEAGAKLLGYLPDFAFTAFISPDAVSKVKDLECVAALLPFKPEYKIDPELPSNSLSDEDIDIIICTFDTDLSQLENEIAKDKAVIIYESKDSIRLVTKVKYISDFSKIKAVEYIEEYHKMYIN